jgi:hypothetical protein
MEICVDDTGNIHICDEDGDYHSLMIDRHNNPIFVEENFVEPNIVDEISYRPFVVYRDPYKTDDEDENYEIVYDYKNKHTELEQYDPGLEMCLFNKHSDKLDVDIILRDNSMALYNSKIYHNDELMFETDIYPSANLYDIVIDTSGQILMKSLNEPFKIFNFGWENQT